MAQIITATAEPDFGRVKIEATGGTVGDAFYVVRKDGQGSNLIRDTTGDGVTWQVDPNGLKKNLFKNPDFFATSGTTEIRRNLCTNPNFALPTSNIAAGWSAYSSGTVTGTRTNDGANGQYIETSSIAAGAKYGIVSAAQTFTATTRRVMVRVAAINGTVDGAASLNTTAANVLVSFQSGATVVSTQTVAMANWNDTTTVAYSGGSSVDRVIITIYLENTTGATITTPQRLWLNQELLEVTNLTQKTFSGNNPADGDLTYSWAGTANASASTATKVGVALCPSYSQSRVYQSQTSIGMAVTVESNGVGNISYTSFDGASGAMRVGMVAGKTYTIKAKCIVDSALTGTLHGYSRRITATYRQGAAAAVTASSNQAPNVPGVYDLSVTFTIPADATEAYILGYVGSATEGEKVHFDKMIVIEGNYTGPWFSGRSENASWDGAADNSTSTMITSALPITMYDYEARQGFTTIYTITNDLGVPDASDSVDIPVWGTWIKDPFRPFLNCRVLWNSDSEYTRESRREKLWARGAQFPVFHSDKRSKPRGQVVLATETTEQAKAFTSLMDQADVVMIDVDAAFGVPVRYVSVGDISGSRTSSDTSRDLGYQARYWTLQIDEVAMPIGAPVDQNITYDMLAANFGSYVAIPASVPTYDDLASGNWG